MDDHDKDQGVQQQQPPSVEAEATSATSSAEDGAPSNDRSDLLVKARAFLASPQVRHEDNIAKRRFLKEKGLDDAEIDSLLQDQPPQLPLLPPRTYPQPPPSNLPNLLLGVARIVSWIAGGSAALLLVYFRFLYPRIAKTFQARHSLRSHHKDLLSKLTESLESLKATQVASSAVLPRPEPFQDIQYGHCQTLDEVVKASAGRRDVPEVTLLRCAISGVKASSKTATTDEIFLALEANLPWLKQSDGSNEYEEKVWQTLSTSAFFRSEETGDSTVWSYIAPSPPSPSPLLQSLIGLKSSLSSHSPPRESRFEHTMQALASLTGYIATQTYATFRMPTAPFGAGLGAPGLSTEEEEVRREIRALKGLVLNRRTFMPQISRPMSTPTIAAGSTS